MQSPLSKLLEVMGEEGALKNTTPDLDYTLQ